MTIEDRLRDASTATPRQPMPSASDVMQRGHRRRARRRAVTGAAIVATIAVVAIGVSLALDQDDTGEVRTVESPDGTTITPPDSTTATITVPDVIGLDVDAARDALETVGLVGSVNEGDADLSPAIVVAQEPGAGLQARDHAVVGLRTLFPDPPESLECEGDQHPHGPADADVLPTVDAVTDRGLAEDAVRALGVQRGSPNVFLAQWDRYAWQRVGGEVETVPTTGYQVVIVHDGPTCGPVIPSFFDGIPVTEVRGPLDQFAASLEAAHD